MTEAEWLACSDPIAMVDLVRWKASERKQRLFACAFVGHYGHMLRSESSRAAIKVSEAFADQRATKEELKRTRRAAASAARGDHRRWKAYKWVARAAKGAASVDIACYLTPIVDALGRATEGQARDGASEHLRLAGSLHLDIIGLRPNGSKVSVPPSVLGWADHTVSRIAQGIYDDRAFDRLPILHDALLDAGCDDEAILSHCREAGRHVRGCWVIDLLLGKE